ncbi:unnamed protein product [Rangifer tarandus platyrhynchus]|uniref:Uncharacterized protein n=2 Tax=Rangifer tarandus platyrhynchus TaxID=3082113 RepID=A0ABN8YY09_RANTA|nr:unnamed protein product [Rangifer tarandus platyrhynchus]
MSGKIPFRTSRVFVRKAGAGGFAGRRAAGSAVRSMAATVTAAPPAPEPARRAPPPGPIPGPEPRPTDPGGPGGVPRAKAAEPGAAYQVIPGCPAVTAGVKFTSGLRTVRGPGAAGPSEAARGRRPRGTLHPAPRRRCHPGPATPTLRTVAELEVSGLRGALGWVSAASSELGNKEGAQAWRGEERKKYDGETPGYLEISRT